jgi:predicted nuclease of predicted toxin-antitoxin system
MAKFLANENVPGEVVEAARQAGHDLAWIAESSPGVDDDAVLATALAERRVPLTFDKDFGEMAFRQGKTTTYGVVLLGPRVRSPSYLAQFLLAVLGQPVTWDGNLSVAQEGKLRVVPLSESPTPKRRKPRKRKK